LSDEEITMLKQQYARGRAAALAHYKLAAPTTNPVRGLGAPPPPPNAFTAPPTTPAAPVATGAVKAKVLG